MNGAYIIRSLLSLIWLPLLTGCDIDGDLPECEWNVSIDYTYAPYGWKLPLEGYMTRFNYYVFDEQGTLVDTGGGKEEESTGRGITCSFGQIRFKLPPGRYTAVAWANIGNNTNIAPRIQPDVSTLQELMLQRRETAPAPDRLYYGAIPFEVGEGLSHYEAALTDAFARLSFVVHWAEGQQPAPDRLKDLNIRLTQTPATLAFAPGEQVQAYRNDVARFLPATAEPTGSYRQPVNSYGGRIEAAVTLCRLALTDHPVFCLYAGDTPLMKEIDLQHFFIDTETDLKGDCIQDYGLDVEIGKNSVIVSYISMGDWEEGGDLSVGW